MQEHAYKTFNEHLNTHLWECARGGEKNKIRF